MMWSALVGGIVWIMTAIVSWLPSVTTLPTIGGVDIDSALVTGVGEAYNFATDVWVIKDVLIGAAFIWGYYGLKMLLRLLIGHRAPH